MPSPVDPLSRAVSRAATRTSSAADSAVQGASATALQGPQALTSAAEFRGPTALDDSERGRGLHMNRLEVSLGANAHFSKWWEVVPEDTAFVVVQGAAYQGRSVQVGHERYETAVIIHMKRHDVLGKGSTVRQHEALRDTVSLDIAGKAGEEVRVLYYRVAKKAIFNVAQGGRQVQVLDVGQAAGIGGDPHWRDVRVTIAQTGDARSAPSDAKFNYYHPDGYDQTARRAGRDTRGPKGYNHLGGDASPSKLRAQSLDPMTH